jgi:hypothetical protein
VVEGLDRLSVEHEASFFRLRSEWYGFDPIHIRPALWRSAWREILGVDAESAGAEPASRREMLRLHATPPERQWLCGRERVTPQTGTRLASGGRLWLY